MTAAWAAHGDLSSMPPPEQRRVAEQVRAPWARGGPDVPRRESVIAGVRVRIFNGGANGTLVYLHGGGWTMFSLDTHDRVMREYASRAGMNVIGVDYALSPEAKYPVALRQVVGVVREIGKVAIGGDSAGANLALAAAIALRDERRINAIVLNYGVFDRNSSPEARATLGAPGNVLTADEMDELWQNYLTDEAEANDPLVSPLRADLTGLPRTLLVVPEYDLLTEQSVRLAARLAAAGVAVEMKLYRGAVHSFLEAVSISKLAQQAFDDTAKWLRG